MKTKIILFLIAVMSALSLPAQTTAFTYQGRLTDNGVSPSGAYDLQFILRDAATAGNQVGAAVTNVATAVSNGLFTAALDFGAGSFNGSARWLEVGVRTNGNTGPFVILAPRQAVTSAPYAIQAVNAANVSGSIADAQLSSNIPRLNGTPVFSGTLTAASIAGSGSGLTALNASQLTSGTVPAPALGNAWQIIGNAGTTPGTHFLGTTDNRPLDFRVNNTRATRLEQPVNDSNHSNLVNILSGSPVNFFGPGIYGATIAGGGAAKYFNSVVSNSIWADLATISGGADNSILDNSIDAVIAGGLRNSIYTNSFDSAIGGGYTNVISANANASVIAGGAANLIAPGASLATISGGANNTIQSNAFECVIGGGYQNSIQTNSDDSVISGGDFNAIEPAAYLSIIGGGEFNTIQANAYSSSLLGGRYNTIQTASDSSFLGGGYSNTISARLSTLAGGYANTVLPSGNLSTISGGLFNTNMGSYATIPGGDQNVAGTNSFAAGHRAKATHMGAFVWGDSTDVNIASTASNQFTVRASGGVRLYSNGGATSGVTLGAGATSWAAISDRNAKKNFQPLDCQAVLEKLAAMPVQRWNYKWESDTDVPHIGPVAQDFKGAFYPGRDDKSITTLEFDGVELAAIQGLNEQVREKDKKIAALEKRLADLEKRVSALAPPTKD